MDDASESDLAEALFRTLSSAPHRQAKMLKDELGVDRRQVNSVLYARQDLFVASDDQPPYWSTVGLAAAQPEIVEESPPVPRAPRRPRTSAGSRKQRPSYRWQDEALRAWRVAGRRGIVEAVTGTGKTHIGVAAIREHAKAGGRALVLVPAVALLRQWQAELERYVPEGRVGVLGDGESSTLHGYDVVVSTVQTARGHPRILPPGIEGLLVADECHRYAGEEFRRALRETFAARLGLSATLARPDGAHDTVLMPYFEQVVFTLDYRRALSDGIIAQVEVAFVCVPFSAGETSRYEEHSAKMHAARSRLVHTYGLTPEPFGAFLAEVTRLQQDFGSPGQREASTYLRSWTGRRDLLANTDAKLRLLPKLAPAIQRSDRSILFTQRTRSADRIVAELRSLGVDAAAHHSEISGDDKRRALDDFAEGRLKAIVAVDTLTEGIDVPQADLEIVMAASQQRRQMIQRMGRVLRPKADGRAARFAIVSVAGTCEDPALGAYEQFLEDLLDIASAEGHFDGATPVRTISDFLSPREQGDDGVIRS